MRAQCSRKADVLSIHQGEVKFVQQHQLATGKAGRRQQDARMLGPHAP